MTFHCCCCFYLNVNIAWWFVLSKTKQNFWCRFSYFSPCCCLMIHLFSGDAMKTCHGSQHFNSLLREEIEISNFACFSALHADLISFCCFFCHKFSVLSLNPSHFLNRNLIKAREMWFNLFISYKIYSMAARASEINILVGPFIIWFWNSVGSHWRKVY